MPVIDGGGINGAKQYEALLSIHLFEINPHIHYIY